MRLKVKMTKNSIAAVAIIIYLAVLFCCIPLAFSQVNINGARVNAASGFTYQGLAPLNQVLCGDGTFFKPASSCGTVAQPFYQTVQANGTAQPQRFVLNFDSNFTLTDSSSGTSVHLPATIAVNISGVAATASYLAGPIGFCSGGQFSQGINVHGDSLCQTIDASNLSGLAAVAKSGAASDVSGLAKVATSGTAADLTGLAAVAKSGAYSDLTGTPQVTPRTCNASGCYRIAADGTYEQWGIVGAPTSSGTLVTVGITFPVSFPRTLGTLQVTGGSTPDGGNDNYTIYHTGSSTYGATAVIRCATNIGGSGCPSISTSIPVHWYAVGY